MVDLKFIEVLRTEFSDDFVKGMKERMVVSFYKYGPVAEGFPEKVDAIGSLMQRLREYAKTGNTEYLIDAANFAMIEFMHPRHPEAKFQATDDSGSPGRISLANGRSDARNNEEIGTNPNSITARFR
jgi:hypothetical protein